MKRPSVAVIDDEAGVRKGLSRLLRSAEFDPLTYASGEEFLEAWPSIHPDCIVMDLQMPDVSGFEVQANLKRAGVQLPVIIITAHDEPEARAKCILLGAAAYLCKPLDGEVLLDAIWSVLETAGGPHPRAADS
ncbi:MAG: response regulator [Steroidobacteraceae bacterium]